MTTETPQAESPPESVAAACCDAIGHDGDESATCPMTAILDEMRGKVRPGLAFLLLIPAAVLVGLGALMVLEPAVLVWLVAAVLALIGLGLLRGAFKLHRFLRSVRKEAAA